MNPFGSMFLPLRPVNLTVKLSCHSGLFHAGCISHGKSIAWLGAGLLVPLSCLRIVDLPSFKLMPLEHPSKREGQIFRCFTCPNDAGEMDSLSVFALQSLCGLQGLILSTFSGSTLQPGSLIRHHYKRKALTPGSPKPLSVQGSKPCPKS